MWLFCVTGQLHRWLFDQAGSATHLPTYRAKIVKLSFVYRPERSSTAFLLLIYTIASKSCSALTTSHIVICEHAHPNPGASKHVYFSLPTLSVMA